MSDEAWAVIEPVAPRAGLDAGQCGSPGSYCLIAANLAGPTTLSAGNGAPSTP